MRVLSKLKKPRAARILGGALGLLLVLTLVLVPVPALAIPPSGHVFHGIVTGEGGPVAQGTPITASVPGGPDYTTQTIDAEGSYSLLVEADDPDTPEKDGASAGDLIEFYIDGVKAELYDVEADEWLDSYPFEIQGLTELNLMLPVADTTAPTVTIDDVADYVNALAQISGTASDDVALDKVRVSIENTTESVFWNGTDWSSATEVWLDATGTEVWTYTMPALTSGKSYQVRAKAIDTSTNESAVASDSFTFDTAAPTVTITSPVAEAPSVAVDSVVTATFDEAIDEATLVFTLGAISGTTTYDIGTNTANFTPDANLDYETSYTASVKASDVAGNPMAEAHTWSFTTMAADTTPPTVVSTVPLDADTNVPLDVVVSATFDEDIQQGDNFGSIAISGAAGVSASIDGATLTIAHDNFAYETSYTVTIPAGAVDDLAGNPLAEDKVWSFTTGAAGPVSFTYTLPAGWNLLSTPIKLDAGSDSVEQILGESTDNVEASYRWDAVNQQWAAPTDYELSPLEAVYLKVKSDASATAEFVPYPDYSAPPSRELQTGLNLIGPAPALGESDFPEVPLDQALISIAEAEGGLRGYTMVVSPGLNQPGWAYALGGQIQDLLPFKGYWVVMENADTLYGFSTTPLP